MCCSPHSTPAADRARRMYRTAQRTRCPTPSTSKCPAELALIVDDPRPSALPTHILAVHAESSGPEPTPVTLYPVHGLVLAASCAHLPAFPSARSKAAVPVLPLRVPCAAAFPLLLAYLYHRRPERLLSALLPALDAPAPRRALAQRVRALWRTGAALGVPADDAYWAALDLAWSLVLRPASA
jgi:hypothetical protein